MNRIKENIRLDYFYRFFSNFSITSAIWVLYLGYKGMNLIQIGLLESIFHITGLIFEIPTGAIADLLGRKKTIVIGRVLSLVACLIVMFSNNFIYLAIGFSIDALSYNLNSGSEDALVYDSLKILGKENEYEKILGRYNLIIEIAGGIAVFIGGALANISFTLSYAAAIFINLISLFFSLRFFEVLNKEKEVRGSLKETLREHFKGSYFILKENKRLRKLLVFFPLVSVFSATVFFYGQQYFSDSGLSKIQISLIFLAHGIFSGLGSLLSSKINRALKEKGYLFIPLGISVSIILFSLADYKVGIFSFCFIGFFTAMLYPISSNMINELIPSKMRATIISIDSMIFSIGMVLLFPIAGVIGEYISLRFAFLIIGIIISILGSIIFYLKNIRK